jgi:U4/U6 small nuclear ribonucleoprotein PRP4
MDFDEIEEATGYEQGLAAEYARQETQALLDELERKKRARAIAVPTDDGRVKKRLRELGEPITLFGERAADRRARLIQLLSRRGDDVQDTMDVDSEDSEEVRLKTLFFHVEDQYFIDKDQLLLTRKKNSTLLDLLTS